MIITSPMAITSQIQWYLEDHPIEEVINKRSLSHLILYMDELVDSYACKILIFSLRSLRMRTDNKLVTTCHYGLYSWSYLDEATANHGCQEFTS